jgi:hypothetical protein
MIPLVNCRPLNPLPSINTVTPRKAYPIPIMPYPAGARKSATEPPSARGLASRDVRPLIDERHRQTAEFRSRGTHLDRIPHAGKNARARKEKSARGRREND